MLKINFENLFPKNTLIFLFIVEIILMEVILMANYNKKVVPEAQAALDKFKMEVANEIGVNLKQGYNGDLTSKQAGSVGGEMVKRMIQQYENNIKTNQ